MQGVRDSRKESCAMQRVAKVKDGKIIGKRENTRTQPRTMGGRTVQMDMRRSVANHRARSYLRKRLSNYQRCGS